MAVRSLEHSTGEKFGVTEKQSIEGRNAAVEKAREWLAKHPGNL
jgi:hypothetical protein